MMDEVAAQIATKNIEESFSIDDNAYYCEVLISFEMLQQIKPRVSCSTYGLWKTVTQYVCCMDNGHFLSELSMYTLHRQ